MAVTCVGSVVQRGRQISGPSASGMVLVNGTDTLAVKSGASSFTMPAAVPYTSAYAVAVQSQPIGLTCSVSNGAGTMQSAAVTNIVVSCAANTYTVGGTINGLTASSLVLLNNGSDAITLGANASQFTMNTGVAYGSVYAITVQTAPTGLVCSVSNGTGTMGAADVTSVGIACVSNFTLLHSFAGHSSDGANPYHTLIQGSDGDFYGTTLAGGAATSARSSKSRRAGVRAFFTLSPASRIPVWCRAAMGISTERLPAAAAAAAERSSRLRQAVPRASYTPFRGQQ